jgi:hypothetical protein
MWHSFVFCDCGSLRASVVVIIFDVAREVFF